MARDRDEDNEGPHSIRLPGQILEQIQSKEDKGDYNEDNSRFTKFESKKRKTKSISRKEKRQQERHLKKQKRNRGKQVTQRAGQLGLKAQDQECPESEDPLAALQALKEAKKSSKKTNGSGFKIVKEDELSDDEIEDFERFDDENINEGDFDEFEENMPEEDSFDEEESYEENPLEKLKVLKELKKNKSKEDPIQQLKALKEEKKKKQKKEKALKGSKEPRFISPQERELMRRDEGDMAFYAKKLGLKNGKKAKLSKIDDDDLIGGLLDGLDFDFMDDDDRSVEDSESESGNDKELENKLPFTSDDELSEGDFDDELDEDDYKEFQGMEMLGNEEDNEVDDDKEDDEGSFEAFEEDSSDSEKERPVKENPYIAPTCNTAKADSRRIDDAAPSKFVPPALRRKLALESSTVTPEILALQKSIKGPLNKLSEANIGAIVTEVNSLYMSNPRHTVNENLTSIILDSIIQQGRLLDTFVYQHATLVVAIHRLQGVEFGAYFIQTLIEKFEKYQKEAFKGKEVSNIVSLLSSVYMFQLVSSKLLYDVIKVLINDLNEHNAELLLRLIRNSGNQMRTDDPTALKEIVFLINQVSSSLSNEVLNTRTQFLIETITSLKNNKLKINNEASHQLTIRLKKFLGSINSNKFSDPIQVTLDDIHNIETRGKWWLIGSAWKGHDIKNDEEKDINVGAMNDILDNAEPNWMELARAQRMNTDIRRAIFISIMSANDYIDAMTKLDKLALKRSQEREIPRVLIHCTGIEEAWNPYYGILAAKLCDTHSYRKTFQFILWDLIKEFESSNENSSDDEDFLGFDTDDDSKLKKILNIGRFYGYLLAEGSLPLHILRTINFLTASDDTILFMEVLLITFLDQIGKKSQINAIGAGLSKKSKKMYEQKFDDKLLIERILKAQEQSALLRGIRFFLQDKINTSDIISGKKQKRRVEWGVRSMVDIIEEFLKSSNQV